MLPKEIIEKIRHIEIYTNRLVNDLLSGEYRSVFKGRGIDFAEVREYQIGDDIRTIDWNVTARTRHPHVKQYREERELTVMLLVDASSSGDFGTIRQMKGEIAAEICALLAFSAIKNNDRVGLIIFTEAIEKYIPPKKGKNHVLRVIRELLYFRPKERQTNITAALEFLHKVIRRKCVAFLVSDFFSPDYKKALEITLQKHDLIAVTITDPREVDLCDVGLIELEDAETGEQILIDTSDPVVRELFFKTNDQKKAERQKLFRSMNLDFIEVMTDRPYVYELNKFFRERVKRQR
ncbi:MAG: DUF58 domain-containing protein [bacterium]